MIQIIDFFIAGLQAYMLSHFVCKYLQTRYSYTVSLNISIIGLYVQYFVLNYFVFDVAERILIGMIGFTFTGLMIFKGPFYLRIGYALVEYLGFTLLDVLVTVVFFPWMELLVSKDLMISERLLLGRSLYNVTLYLVIIFLEFLLERKSGVKRIYSLAVFLGISQLCIMYCMYENDPVYIARKAMVLAVIYNGVVILGYLVAKAVFQKVMDKQKKQMELEQIEIETRYQYEMYCKAVEKSEHIKDMRHDMRNQLQTARYLLDVSKGDNKDKVETILSNLKEKIV